MAFVQQCHRQRPIRQMGGAKASSCRAWSTIAVAVAAWCICQSVGVEAAQKITQAGCSCLPTWKDLAGIQHSGCANPNSDPKGEWCQVNPSSCLGYYSTYTNSYGTDVFFDYCGSVRETTVNGCLCAPDWSMGPSKGKPHYRDRCAHPEAADGKRMCRVDLATCPKNSNISEFDVCGPLTAAPSAHSKATTYHSCTCLPEWMYTFANGSAANFSGCANPDGDPMGKWCAVDPETCDNYAGEILTATGDALLSYDYCYSQYFHPNPDSCAAELKEFEQCGGKSRCSDYGCMDAAWPGACCPEGTTCHRQNGFYHQCLSPAEIAKLAANGTSDSSVSAAIPKPSSTPVNSSRSSTMNRKKTSGNSQTSSGPSAAEQQEDGAQGVRLYTQLKIGSDYDALVASPEKMAHFKNDIVTWLKAVAADPAYIASAGVDQVTRGSVVALAHIQFTPGTPAAEVDAATARLRSSANSLYASSHLPEAWGSLVSYLVASNSSSLATGNMAGIAAAAGDASEDKLSTLGTGAIIGVAVGAACLLSLMGFVLIRTISDKDRRQHDVDVAAKLDYLNDLQEGDLVGPVDDPPVEQEEEEGGGEEHNNKHGGGNGAELTSVYVSDGAVDSGHSRLWYWLGKADTPQPTAHEMAARPRGQTGDDTIFVPVKPGPSHVSTSTQRGSESGLAVSSPMGSCGTRDSYGVSVAEPDAAFLPLPEDDDDTATAAAAGQPTYIAGSSQLGSLRVSNTSGGRPSYTGGSPAGGQAGIAFASLKQRRISTASTHSSMGGQGRDSQSGAAAAGSTGAGGSTGIIQAMSRLGQSFRSSYAGVTGSKAGGYPAAVVHREGQADDGKDQ